MAGPLTGIRVLDLSRLLPGPFCSMMLADMGAEVIKVEEPGRGDYSRNTPPLTGDTGTRFLMLNRNKRSITLNLKKPEGKRIFRSLAEDADVLLESFRPGVMKSLGLDYEEISQVNPGMIYCSLTGYGQDGPYCYLPGHDLNYLGIGGLLEMNGPVNGDPIVPAVPVADLAGGGLMAAVGILAALVERAQTGKGQYLDVAMLDGVISLLPTIANYYFSSGRPPKKGLTRLTGKYPCYYIYKARDGYMVVGALEEKFWVNLCQKLGQDALIPEQFATGSRALEVVGILEKIFAEKSRQEWLDFFADADTCVTPVNNVEEAFADPQVRSRQMLLEVSSPNLGPLKQIGFPIKFSDSNLGLRLPPPQLGEHTAEILEALGYSSEEVKELSSQKVI